MKKILRGKVWGIPVILGFLLFVACEEDFTTIGIDNISSDNFDINSAEFDVFASTVNLNSVQSNGIGIFRLGRLTNPIYGSTNASIAAQATLPLPSPIFGVVAQSIEDIGDTDDNVISINENERVTAVFLNIPFFTAGLVDLGQDTDGDGVPDEFDVDPNDQNSDSDGDGVSDFAETVLGTDPLNPDTDGDGILDGEDDDTNTDAIPRDFDLDSIFGNLETQLNLKIDQLNFFLRDLDPSTGFQQAQAFFSTMDFTPFLEQNLFTGAVEISDEERLVFADDDPDTEDIDESENVLERIPPGLRIELAPEPFQAILDAEGSSTLSNNDNFREFFRGLFLSVNQPILGSEGDLQLLLAMGNATIDIEYAFDRVNENGTSGIGDDDFIEEDNDVFTLNFFGNIVNTFDTAPLPSNILSDIAAGTDASRLYLNGGAGTMVTLNLFDSPGSTENLELARANEFLVNEANLVFHIDRETLDNVGGVTEPLRIYLYNLENNTVLIDYTVDSNPQRSNNFGVFDGNLQVDENGQGAFYRIRLTQHVSQILAGDIENVTLGLAITSDITNPITITGFNQEEEEFPIPVSSIINPFGTVLFSGNVPPEEEDQRLRLEILFTDPTDNN